jgi:hypothetical protein
LLVGKEQIGILFERVWEREKKQYLGWKSRYSENADV